MIKSFLDLDVYKESFQLSLEIDEEVKSFNPTSHFNIQLHTSNFALQVLTTDD